MASDADFQRAVVAELGQIGCGVWVVALCLLVQTCRGCA